MSRSDCESVCRGLQQHGIEAVVYHSALSDSARKEAQEKWLAGDKKVGKMHITKSHISIVLTVYPEACNEFAWPFSALLRLLNTACFFD